MGTVSYSLLMLWLCRWLEVSSPIWTTCVMWNVVASTPWCVICAMSSTNLHVCWTATTSSVPGVYVAGPMKVVSVAPSVGKKMHCDGDLDQCRLSLVTEKQKSVI